jgi:hypothetical protein
MTTWIPMEKKCAVCGNTHTYHVLASTNSFGAPDLDLRPAPMQRETMEGWLEECPECGYIAKDIRERPEKRTVFQEERYRTADNIPFESALAERFYKYHLYCESIGDVKGDFYALLHSAWACDDADDIENARRMRREAVRKIDAIIKEHPENETNTLLMKADILRRSGDYDKVIALYEGMHFEEPLLDQIRMFQIERAKAHDDGCYTVAEVTGQE